MMERSEEKQCVDCGTPSPETETDFTLISSLHGWRLVRRVGPGGALVVEWRCPRCWQRHKASSRKDGVAGPPPAPQDEVPPSSVPLPREEDEELAPPTTRRRRLSIVLVGAERLARASIARELVRAGYDVRLVGIEDVPQARDLVAEVVVVDAGAFVDDAVLRPIERAFRDARFVLRATTVPSMSPRRHALYTLVSPEAPIRHLVAAVRRSVPAGFSSGSSHGT